MVKYIGFCCTTAQKEPVQPIIENICKLIHDGDEYRMIIYHCFEDLYSDDQNNHGAATVFDVINYDIMDVMVIAATSIYNKEIIKKLIENCNKHNIPVVTIDERYEGASEISFAYGEAFSILVDHILGEHGAKRIKLVAGLRGNEYSQTRIDSCAEVMQRYGLTLEDKNIMYGDFWELPTYAAMEEFFASGEPLPDAFICCNDSMAMAVCLKLAEKGFRVPEDVMVTGFDGIETEKYHSPRLTTATRDNTELVKALLDMIGKLIDGAQPYKVELSYTPVFSESCGCSMINDDNRTLLDLVQSHASARLFEEQMNGMSHHIAANPNLEHARGVIYSRAFNNTVVCVTEEFYQGLHSEYGEEQLSTAGGPYPETMRVLMSKFSDGRKSEDNTVFPTSQLLPDLENSFGEHNAIFIIPLHFLDRIVGYFMTHYSSMSHYNELIYTFSTYLNSCLETVNMHERLTGLNRKMEFMFTHDHLTQIYNRYGFYNNFKHSFAELGADKRDVFIASVDLNDMKYINDTFGHACGDDALELTAAALVAAAEGDENIICSRFGGDEFVVARICSGDAKERSERYQQNFCNALAECNARSGYKFKVAASIGIHSADIDDMTSIDRLIELADRMMYTDKAKYKRNPIRN